MPLGAVTPSMLKGQPDDKLRRESFAFSAAWRSFRSEGKPLPDGLSPRTFLKKWQAVTNEMENRGIKGAFGPPDLPKDLEEGIMDQELEITEEKSFSPPSSVRSAAKRGLEMRDKYNRGGTAVGIARARDLSAGKNIPISTIRRMNRFFIRHEKNKDSGPEDGRNGKIAWLLWGGTPAQRWVRGILRKEGLLEGARLYEALKPVKVPDDVYFQIEDRKASFIKEIPQGSRPVRPPDRKWAIIVADQQSGENRSRVITARNRTELVRRTKQETRRLQDPKFLVTGGEFRALDPSGQELFLVVTSWIWKGDPPVQQPPVQESDLEEGVYLDSTQAEVIRQVQNHLIADEAVPEDVLETFLDINPVPSREPAGEPDGPSTKMEVLPMPASVKAMEAVAKAYALEGDQRAIAAQDAWSSLELSYLAVSEEHLFTALKEAADKDQYLEAVQLRVISLWPGFLTFDRLLTEDRLLIEAEDGLLVRVASGMPVDLRPTWAAIRAQEAADPTGLQLDVQDLSAVGSSREIIHGDEESHGEEGGLAGSPLAFAQPGMSPAEHRAMIRERMKRQKQGELFGCGRPATSPPP